MSDADDFEDQWNDLDSQLIEALREPNTDLANSVLERVRHEPGCDRAGYVYETMRALADVLENHE